MNDTISQTPRLCVRAIQTVFCLIAAVSALVCLAGCGDQAEVSSAADLAEFQKAGPALAPTAETSRLEWASIGGPYRAVPGDAIELTMPAILRTVAAEETAGPDRIMPYVCRVNENGTISLPRAGDIEAQGKTLAQIESLIVAAYHPKYVVTRPSVFARVVDYSTSRVTISGAVVRPGIYSLRNDQMSVTGLIMEAGGILPEGAAMIRIFRRDAGSAQAAGASGQATKTNQARPAPLALPVQGLNVPFMDVELHDGDRVIVERLSQPIVTVVGLVNRPGSFPYTAGLQYNLTQALGFAGGLNPVAEPRYATIHRLKPDGTGVSVTLDIVEDSKLTESSLTAIKPGDIIDVQQTPRTRTALFLDRVFQQISIGAYYRLDEAWSD
jgi:polysaccharide export outer membrane protein